MLTAMSSPKRLVIRCPASRRPEAFRQLHAGLPSDQQAALPQALERAVADDPDAWDGLFVCDGGDARADTDSIAGVVWVQPLPGNTAVIWPPDPHSVALEPLLHAAAAFVDERDFPLAQMVVSANDDYPLDVVARSGFGQLVELMYLYRDLLGYSGSPKGLQFIPHAGDHSARLAAILQSTYAGTKDCPALDGIRPLDEVIDGYRAQGEYLPEHWYLVNDGSADVGALIVAYHRGVENCELVYMGVTPQARGRGLGKQIVQFALNASATIGAKRLVLAVDSANSPALKVYGDLNFLPWDRRVVYARLRAPA